MAWNLVPPLMLAALFEACSGFLASIYAALKKTKFLSISTGIGVVVNLGLNWLLISILGIIGAPIATFLSFVVVWAIRLMVLKKFISLDVNYKKTVSMLLLLTAGGLYFAFDCPYKTVVYGLCICVIFAVSMRETKEMLFAMRKLIKRA